MSVAGILQIDRRFNRNSFAVTLKLLQIRSTEKIIFIFLFVRMKFAVE